jgi:hypothetical protein
MEVMMTIATRNRRFGRLAAAVTGAAALCAVTIPLAPAKAQVYFGFGPRGVEVDLWAPTPYYYSPYYAPYYSRYYAPYYYRPYYRYW